MEYKKNKKTYCRTSPNGSEVQTANVNKTTNTCHIKLGIIYSEFSICVVHCADS